MQCSAVQCSAVQCKAVQLGLFSQQWQCSYFPLINLHASSDQTYLSNLVFTQLNLERYKFTKMNKMGIQEEYKLDRVANWQKNLPS